MDGAGPPLPPDVRLCGYLRKQKSQRRRFFVLRRASACGPARLEYYASEKKFRAAGPGARPRRAFPLAGALSISKRADARHTHLLVLHGRDGSFGVAADSAEQQQAWHAALLELHAGVAGKASLEGDGDALLPGPAFREVWQVSLRPRGLGHTRNLAGTYLLCLTEKTISFVKRNSAVATVVLQLLNVRRCGHSENYFFMEVGRSAVTGPGELWMQVEDLVVAQNMHETILEAMKALSDEFRICSKSHSLASAPISVPSRQQHLRTPQASQATIPWRLRPEGTPTLSRSPGAQREKGAGLQKPHSWGDDSAVSSDEGGSSPGDLPPSSTPDTLKSLAADGELDYISMGRLALPSGHGVAKCGLGPESNKRASLPPMALGKDSASLPCRKPIIKPVVASASYPEGLDRRTDPGYMVMLPGVALRAAGQVYIPMTLGRVLSPQESGGYVLMSPSGSCSPDGPGQWVPGSLSNESSASDYMNMASVSQSASSTPPEDSPLLAPPGGAPFYSLPRSYKHGAGTLPLPFLSGRLSSSSSTSSESLEESADTLYSTCPPPRQLVGLARSAGAVPAAPHNSGDYVRIGYGSRAPGCLPLALQAAPEEASKMLVPVSNAAVAPGAHLVRADARRRRRHESEAFPSVERQGALPSEAKPGLNYVDLDLAKEAGPEAASAPRPVAVPGQAGPQHSYASIAFHRLGESHPEGAES